MASTTRDPIVNIWGQLTPYRAGDSWPVRLDSFTEEEPDRWVQSCCVLCTNGCGLDIAVKDNRIVGVRGRADDRINRGRLGPKGMFAWKANSSPDRLTKPLIRDGKKGAGLFREASWDEAMDLVVRQCREIRDEYTSGAIGIYNTGQRTWCLTVAKENAAQALVVKH